MALVFVSATTVMVCLLRNLVLVTSLGLQSRSRANDLREGVGLAEVDGTGDAGSGLRAVVSGADP